MVLFIHSGAVQRLTAACTSGAVHTLHGPPLTGSTDAVITAAIRPQPDSVTPCVPAAVLFPVPAASLCRCAAVPLTRRWLQGGGGTAGELAGAGRPGAAGHSLRRSVRCGTVCVATSS